jgi:hypothetical protein
MPVMIPSEYASAPAMFRVRPVPAVDVMTGAAAAPG